MGWGAAGVVPPWCRAGEECQAGRGGAVPAERLGSIEHLVPRDTRVASPRPSIPRPAAPVAYDMQSLVSIATIMQDVKAARTRFTFCERRAAPPHARQ